MKTFQKPLSSEEERYYIQMLQRGSSEEALRAKEILIERNMRLVAHIAKKYQNVEEMEDLISIGTIGLIKAVESFNIEKGKLATYACRCIENELLMLLRAKKKSAKDVSLYDPIGTDKEGNEIRLLDIVEQDEVDVVEQLHLTDKIKKMYMLMEEILTDREKEILIARYGLFNQNEITQNEIGEQMNISRSYVSRIEKKALVSLRNAFEKEC